LNVPHLYRQCPPEEPIAQGDIFRGIPIPLVQFDRSLSSTGGGLQPLPVTGPITDATMFLAVAEITDAIVTTQSCDAPRANRILLAPMAPMSFPSNKPEKMWEEIQRLATSLQQPTGFYLPDFPDVQLSRQVVELSETFCLQRSELERFVSEGKRVASLSSEGVTYLSFRIAMMFWRAARDDDAWPSKADLQLKMSKLESTIAKRKTAIDHRRKQTNPSLDDREELAQLQSEVTDLESQLSQIRAAVSSAE
jgi:hypothetical protein